MAGSDQFTRYEGDLIAIIKSAKTKLADQIPISDKEERKALLRQVNKEIDEIYLIIDDMEREINKALPNSRASLTGKLKQYKRDIEIIEKELKKAGSVNAMSNYGSTQGATNDTIVDPERKKVIQIHNSLMRGTESIARSTQIAVETEEIGNQVLSELNQQGEKLKKTSNRLDETGEALTKSRRIIMKLQSSILCNKFVLIVLIFLELCILGGAIYFKFFT